MGPLMTITGLRPKSVVGFEVPPPDSIVEAGRRTGAGMEIVTMENGAIFKSLHGPIKREPAITTYAIYGNKGCMESGHEANKKFNLYREGETVCKGEWERYDPDIEIAREDRLAVGIESHGGSDFYPTHCFIEKILGNEDGQWSIDVYTAVDMSLVGILAYRSILNGNASIEIPNFRNKEERDAWRNDHACTNPEIAGDQLLPTTSVPALQIPHTEEEAIRLRNLWLAKEKARLEKEGK
jgi:hypothetical protein